MRPNFGLSTKSPYPCTEYIFETILLWNEKSQKGGKAYPFAIPFYSLNRSVRVPVMRSVSLKSSRTAS